MKIDWKAVVAIVGLMWVLATASLSAATPIMTSSFCEGWDDGYQQALEDCWRAGVTPICPIEPINSDGYKTGYGYGYAAAKKKHCDG